MILKINDALNKLKKSGLYSLEQMSALEYAIFLPNVNCPGKSSQRKNGSPCAWKNKCGPASGENPERRAANHSIYFARLFDTM